MHLQKSISPNSKKHDLKQDEIVVNGALFIVAGSETTANLLSGLIARLIWNPDKYAYVTGSDGQHAGLIHAHRKLVAEIRSACKNEADVTYESMSNLPYLNACLEEGLRVHPPVPTGLLRTVPKGGDTIDGTYVPEGVSHPVRCAIDF